MKNKIVIFLSAGLIAQTSIAEIMNPKPAENIMPKPAEKTIERIETEDAPLGKKTDKKTQEQNAQINTLSEKVKERLLKSKSKQKSP